MTTLIVEVVGTWFGEGLYPTSILSPAGLEGGETHCVAHPTYTPTWVLLEVGRADVS